MFGPDGKVEIRKVQIGTDLGTQFEIVNGLSTTDQLIVNPSDSLSNGMAGLLMRRRASATR